MGRGGKGADQTFTAYLKLRYMAECLTGACIAFYEPWAGEVRMDDGLSQFGSHLCANRCSPEDPIDPLAGRQVTVTKL